jgi:hypothetical protein
VAIKTLVIERFSKDASVPDGIGAFGFFAIFDFDFMMQHAGSGDLNFAARQFTV